MDRDYHIRILLEARDRVSQVINNIVIRGNRNLVILGDSARSAGEKIRSIEKDVDIAGRAINRNSSFFARFVAGMREAETGARRLSDGLRRDGGNWSRFGFFVRSTVRDVDRFINLRWLLVTGFVTVFGNAIAILAANLLSLAASATRAAAVLGGALLAGISQLIPVVALLQATFLRLEKVSEAVEATEKARLSASEDAQEQARSQRDAEERLADARFNLLRANEAVLDAEYELREARRSVAEAERDHRRAVEELAEAREDAARKIIDSRLEEREAALSLEEAELAVLEAKERLREEEERRRLGGQDLEFARAQVREAQERLRIVEAQGDQAEISSATQQLAFAEQNLNAILNSAEQRTTELKRTQLDVDQAILNREQAVVRNRRTQQDVERTRAEGVEGSDEVVRARERVENAERAVFEARRQVVLQTRALRDASRNVVVALREIRNANEAATDATKRQSAAQENLNEALKELTPAERSLVRAIDRFKRTAQREFGPIQDIITSAFARGVRRAEQLLLDPRIQRAARRLASAIADVVDSFSEFAVSDEFRDAIVFFTEQAADNLPKVGEALLDILRILIRLGRAGTPVFNELLDRFTQFISRIERATRDEERLEKFFGAAGRHLNDWIELAKAVGNLAGAFVFDTDAAASGAGILEDLTDQLNEWAEWIRENPERVESFFARMRENLEALTGVFLRFGALLFRVFTSDEASAFARLILEVVLPAVGQFIIILGQLSRVLIFLFDIPVVGQLLKWTVQFAIIYGLFVRLFAITGILGREGFGFLIRQITQQNSALRRLSRAMLNPIESFRQLRGIIAGKIQTLRIYAGVIEGQLRRALKAGADQASLFATYVRDGARRLKDKTVEVGKAAIALGSRFVGAARNATIAAIDFSKALAGRVLASLRTFAAFLRVQMVAALRILRLNIRLLVGATGIGLIIVAATLIIEHWDKVKAAAGRLIDAFRGIIRWIRENWRDIAKFVGAALLGPAGAIYLVWRFRDRILDAFKAIKNGIINLFREAFTWIRQQFNRLGDWIEEKVRGIPLIGGLIAGRRELSDQDANEILADEALDPNRRKIRRLRRAGLGPKDIIAQLLSDEDIDEDLLQKLAAKYAFQSGGTVPGGQGKPVPILAHAGEWVLNQVQQRKLVERLGMTAEQVKAWLFGTNMGQTPPGPRTTGTKPTDKAEGFRGAFFDLRPQEDEHGVVVWFIEMADGTFGQVSARDAERIKKSNGTWIPGYVKRSTHGYNMRWLPPQLGRGLAAGGVVPSYAMGGVVQPVQSFAEGGVVLNSPSGPTAAPRIGELKQHFEVRAESELDWNYVMRLGAIHALTSY